MTQQEIIYQSLVEMGLAEKYGHPGIYSISIEDKLVYIGKSRDMLIRVANHLTEISFNKKSHKYIILRQAREEGYHVNFNVVEYCKNDQELGEAEARLINEYMPVLNYQIPNIDDYKHYTVNKKAKTITLEEILYPSEVFIFE